MKHLVVYINKADAVDDPEILDLVIFQKPLKSYLSVLLHAMEEQT